MAFISKKRKVAAAKVDANKAYSLKEASALVKQITTCKFDASVDLHIRLGVDPKKADQAIRGTVTLPHGTGKTKRVLVLCTPDKEAEAKAAGADFVGLEEFVTKIEGGWVDVDVIIATPSVMPKIGKLGKVLGPRNLMPNPKTGTVTNDVAGANWLLETGFYSMEITPNTPTLHRLSQEPHRHRLRQPGHAGLFAHARRSLATRKCPSCANSPRQMAW